jgi:hypothetical protein
MSLPSTREEFFEAMEAAFVKEKPSDDMLFYVVENSLQREPESRLFVRRWNAQRKDVPRIEAGDGIDWEASYYLNVIVHLSYELEFKVYRKDEATGAAPLYTELHTKQVPIFASPNRIRVDQSDKASESQLTFPDIYFALHDHHMHDRNNAPLANSNEFVSIRLSAHGHFLGTPLPHVELFRGVASHTVVLSAYSKVQSASARADSRRLPFSRRRPPPSGHYLALRGPRGKGRAQMSVATSLDSPTHSDDDADDANTQAAPAPAPAPAPALVAPDTSPSKPAGLMRALLGSFRRAVAPAETENGDTAADQQPSVPLYCSLTFVSIPYDAIVGDCTKAWLLAREPDTTAELPVEEAK